MVPSRVWLTLKTSKQQSKMIWKKIWKLTSFIIIVVDILGESGSDFRRSVASSHTISVVDFLVALEGPALQWQSVWALSYSPVLQQQPVLLAVQRDFRAALQGKNFQEKGGDDENHENGGRAVQRCCQCFEIVNFIKFYLFLLGDTGTWREMMLLLSKIDVILRVHLMLTYRT